MSLNVSRSHKCELSKENSFETLERNRKGSKLKRKWQSLIVVSVDHPMCGRFFRSEMSVREEKKRQLHSKYPYIIHPLSKFRQVETGINQEQISDSDMSQKFEQYFILITIQFNLTSLELEGLSFHFNQIQFFKRI